MKIFHDNVNVVATPLSGSHREVNDIARARARVTVSARCLNKGLVIIKAVISCPSFAPCSP